MGENIFIFHTRTSGKSVTTETFHANSFGTDDFSAKLKTKLGVVGVFLVLFQYRREQGFASVGFL